MTVPRPVYHTDVLIIGTGPAGGSAAALLSTAPVCPLSKKMLPEANRRGELQVHANQVGLVLRSLSAILALPMPSMVLGGVANP